MIPTYLFLTLSILLSATAQDQTAADGYIIKWHPGHVNPANRRTWIDNQLRKASLPPLTDSQVSSLKIGWETSVFDGFAGSISADAVNAFVNSGDVAYATPDVNAKITTPTAQNDAPWGLARISQKDPLRSGNPTRTDFTYTFDDTAGDGVDIYILDTGVRVTHTDFGGRATFAQTFSTGVEGQDVQGHGTHCAGIAASSQFGVAKKANVIAVKVMDDRGTGKSSDIIAGINFVVRSVSNSNRPSVINLSLTTPASQALDDAVGNAVSFGVHVVVAAGNEGVDASSDSPARANSVITVGATDINDRKASFSNFGPVVDIWAPGVGIISLGNTDDNAIKTLDGTSMAAPFVTGLVAYFLSLNGNMTPLAMKQTLRSLTTNNAINGLTSTDINVLAFNGAVSSTTSTTPVSQQQNILGSIDSLVSAFSALASEAQTAGS